MVFIYKKNIKQNNLFVYLKVSSNNFLKVILPINYEYIIDINVL